MGKRTLSKRALFRRVGYRPHVGQRKVHDSKAKRRVLACGARWGKTLCAAMEGIVAALQPCEHSVGWVVAPTYDLASRVFRQIQVVVLEHLRHHVIEMNEREKWFTIRNMSGGVSEIRAKSADRPVSLLGEALDWLVVDEAARLSRDVWETFLSARLLDKNGWALLISTPKGPNWFYRLYRAGSKGRIPSCECWSAPSWENPHVSKELIAEERMRLTKDVFDEQFGGEFTNCEREPCDTCLGPLEGAVGHAVLREDAELPLCADCKQPIDATTKLSIVRRMAGGEGMFSLVRLYPSRWADPGFPESVEKILREKDDVEEREPFDYEDEDEEEEEAEPDVDDGVEFERRVAAELGIGSQDMVIHLPEAEDMEDWEE